MKIDVTLPNQTETFSVDDADLVGVRLRIENNGSNYTINTINSLEDLFKDTDFPFAYSIREIPLSENIHMTLYCYTSPLFRDLTRFPGMVFSDVQTNFARVVVTI